IISRVTVTGASAITSPTARSSKCRRSVVTGFMPVILPVILPSGVELEQHDVAVLHHIVLALVAGLAGLLGRHLAAQGHEVVIGDGLGADEAALEIGMDDAGRLGGAIALVDGPGARFLG